MGIIPEPILIITPLIAIPLAGWMSDDGLPTWTNQMICVIIVLFFSFVCALLDNDLGGDFLHDMIAIAGYIGGMMAMLSPFLKWMATKTTSPIVAIGSIMKPPATPQPPPTSTPETPTLHLNRENTEPPPHNNWTSCGETEPSTALHQAMQATEVMHLEDVAVQDYVEAQETVAMQQLQERWTAGHRLKLPARVATNG